MKNYLEIPSNFINKLIINVMTNVNRPRTTEEVLKAFGIPLTIIYGSEFAQNPKIFSLNFLLFLVGMGLNICALRLRKGSHS